MIGVVLPASITSAISPCWRWHPLILSPGYPGLVVDLFLSALPPGFLALSQ